MSQAAELREAVSTHRSFTTSPLTPNIGAGLGDRSY